jgi:hypothetical protein
LKLVGNSWEGFGIKVSVGSVADKALRFENKSNCIMNAQVSVIMEEGRTVPQGAITMQYQVFVQNQLDDEVFQR